MTQAAERPDSELLERIRAHLGTDPTALPITTADFDSTDHANLQLALDAVLGDAELLGFTVLPAGFPPSGLATIVSGEGFHGPLKPAAVQYANVEVGDGRVIQCIAAGLFLLERDGVPAAFALSRAERPFGGSQLRFEGLAPKSEIVQATLDAVREHNVYRGRTISLHEDGSASVQFHDLPLVARDAVILPDGTLERLERHALGSPFTPTGCAPPGATSSVESCCTARPAPARRCRSTTC